MENKPTKQTIKTTIEALKQIYDYVFRVFDEESEYKYIEYAETCVSCAEELQQLADYLEVRDYGEHK